jgi:hypothetical protein
MFSTISNIFFLGMLAFPRKTFEIVSEYIIPCFVQFFILLRNKALVLFT